ncbi:unnamed protein product [Phaeothamnion confervicola]
MAELGLAPEPVFPFKDDALSGKTAVITGGADGIGEAITLAFLRAGARVAVIARSRSKFEAMIAKHSLSSERLVFFEADLASGEQTVAAADAAVAWADGTVYCLVNNAGIARIKPLTELTAADWDATMAVNGRAPLLMAQRCVGGMIRRRSGVIVNVSSQAGTVALAGHGAYCASKSALDSLTRVMTLEWSKHNIRCNAIAPTVILTEMGRREWGDPAKSGPMLAKTPLGRFGEPFEVANLCIFLASGASDLICGQTLLMDGGFTAA